MSTAPPDKFNFLKKNVGIVLFAHGSLLCDAGRTVAVHADRLKDSGSYGWVEVGFLNYTDPPIEDAIGRCLDAGMSTVVVVPWFLVPGKFVRVDLPPRIEAAKARYPDAQIVVSGALGPDSALGNLVALSANKSVALADAHLLPAEVGRTCGQNPLCPAYDSAWCRSHATGNQIEGESRNPHAWIQRVTAFGPSDVLLVIAHGSPRVETADLVRKDAAQAAAALGTRKVVTAFLDCNEPDIPAGVVNAANLLEQAPQAGRGMEHSTANLCGAIVLVPYFLHAGKHVARDLLDLANEGLVRADHPPLRVAPHIGWLDELTGLAQSRIVAALNLSELTTSRVSIDE